MKVATSRYSCALEFAEMFELATGHPCHASIKTLDRTGGMVTTRARDALMHNAPRVLADEQLQSYNFRDNTAFARILSDARCDFFMSNWLNTQALCGKYSNSNNNWRRHYAATVVVPISSNSNPTELNPETVIGFICVDNKRGGFSEQYSRALLASFVPLFNDMMVKLGEMALGEGEMTSITKTPKRSFRADVMNKVWDLSNSEYKTIIRKQQAAESTKQGAAHADLQNR